MGRLANAHEMPQPVDLDAVCPLPPDPDAWPRVIGFAEARLRGLSEGGIAHRVATGRWRKLLPRTYLTSDTLTVRDRLDAAVVFAGRGAASRGWCRTATARSPNSGTSWNPARA